jgi:ABC-2 type transport system permease protein
MTSAMMTRPGITPAADRQVATMAGIPFRRLLRVEWSKATDTRAARWLLLAVAASTVGLVGVPLFSPSSNDQSYTSYLGFAAVALSVLLPVVSILTLTSEWSQRTALATFTQEPRRLRIVTAKITVSLILGASAAVFGGLVTAAGLGLAATFGRTLDPNLNVGLIVAFLLYVVLNVMTGVALGALVHNSAAAIVASFVLPIGFALLGRTSQLVADWLDYSTTFNWLLNGQWSGHTSEILVSVILWVAIPLAAGLVRTARREVS